MDLQLAGKTVIVTGGSGAIGRGLVLEFLREGAHVVSADLDPGTHLTRAASEQKLPGTLLPVVTDVTRRASVDRMVEAAREAFSRCGRWDEELPRWYAEGGRPFETRLLEHALDVYRTVDRSASTLVNQDLHGANILAAEREPWLVIDPKPLVGERELEASGLLRNTRDVSRWLDVLVELGFDRERARGWGVAHNLAWAWDERHGWLEQHVEEARRILNAR